MDIIAKKIADIQNFLKLTFSVVPVVAGADKFSNLLTSWSEYLNPLITQMLPFSPSVFMMIVGIIEIAAGFLVFFRPRLGALVVCAWLSLIALSLLVGGKFFDIAVRDLVIAGGALTLSRLTALTEQFAAKDKQPSAKA